MASNFHPFKKQEERTLKGHYVRFQFSVQNAHIIPSWEIPQEYSTNCDGIPTSWKLRVKGLREPDGACSVSLRRTDCIHKPVNAWVWVSCFDVNNRRLSLPKVFTEKKILPNDVVRGYIDRLIPIEEKLILVQNELFIDVSILICFCHKKKENPDAELSSGLQKMQFSKL